MRTIDEATASFLHLAGDDLQRQLGAAGTVISLALDDNAARVTLVAVIRVGPKELEFRGVGDSMLEAYADLVAQPPEPMLVAAFRNLLPA